MTTERVIEKFKNWVGSLIQNIPQTVSFIIFFEAPLPKQNHNVKPQENLRGKGEEKEKDMGNRIKEPWFGWMGKIDKCTAESHVFPIRPSSTWLSKDEQELMTVPRTYFPQFIVIVFACIFPEKNLVIKQEIQPKTGGLIQVWFPGMGGSKRKSDPVCLYFSVQKRTHSITVLCYSILICQFLARGRKHVMYLEVITIFRFFCLPSL